MPGCKRFLNETRQREVCALITAGCDFDQAARYVGCSTKTIRRETARNPEFYERLRRARVVTSVAPLQAVRNAANSHWRAAAWLLERTEPQRYVRCTPNTYRGKEIAGYFEKFLKLVFAEIKDPDMAQRIDDGFTKILSDISFEAWAESASYEQFRKAYPKTRRQRRQPDDSSCTEHAGNFGDSSGQNETKSDPILSNSPVVSLITEDADRTSEGTE